MTDAPTYAELLDALVEMVRQHCCADSFGEADSATISANAAAMRLLERAGKLVITMDRRRLVVGRWTK